MSTTRYSPQEAAIVSGAPLAVIQKAITSNKIPAGTVGIAKRRQLDETALLAFALADAMPMELHLSPGDAYQILRAAQTDKDIGELTIGGLVRVDAGKALAATRRRLSLYERARDLIVKDPAIMDGTPTIKGTRITAQSLLGRIDDGDSIASILEDYPYLDGETVEAAIIYAKANPPRGRPSGTLWRRAS